MTLYVDNVKLVGPDEVILNSISQQIAAWFEIKNLDYTHHYLDMKIEQDCEKKTICLSQEIYIKKLLKQYEMKNCIMVSSPMMSNLKITDQAVKNEKFIEKYQSAVESLQFLVIYT